HTAGLRLPEHSGVRLRLSPAWRRRVHRLPRCCPSTFSRRNPQPVPAHRLECPAVAIERGRAARQCLPALGSHPCVALPSAEVSTSVPEERRKTKTSERRSRTTLT